ncbi:hypothetical protein [Halovivax sp.]|uniref:hypothetical protein n=1 Tax=Halovivax sp. TaxID=1935978 RepID=UPI0025C018F0|nr:hypothetical protein [Halovivax sp.]
MQTLEVTDEQHAYIQRLRAQLSEEVVGKYGTVRECDAVQFLIDNLDDELEIDGKFDPEPADDGREISYEERESADEAPGDDRVDSADEPGTSDEGESAADDEEAGGPDVGADESGADSDGEDDDGTDGSASDDDMLDQMMNLLDTHEDKWEESPSADYRYRVELPDGATEDVQTKDDVRAILFKNYR